MAKEKSKKLFASAMTAAIALGASAIISAHAQNVAVAIVDENGNITPSRQLGTNIETNASATVGTSSKNTLQVDDNSAVKKNKEATSTSEEYGTTSTKEIDDRTATPYAELGTGSFFSRLQTWSHQLFNSLNLSLTASTTDSSSSVTSLPIVETTSSSSKITWSSPGHLIERVYYGSSTPLTITSATPYINTWGMVRHTARLNHLSASTIYYYRIVPVGFASGTTSPLYSFTTKSQ